MSHFTTLKTQFVSREHLVRALADVSQSFGLGEVHENAVARGFRGDTRQAELVVSTRNAGYDIGFSRDAGHYAIVADWWGIRDVSQQKFSQRLAQRYAYHVVREKLDEKRFILVEEHVEQDQTIRLLVRRV